MEINPIQRQLRDIIKLNQSTLNIPNNPISPSSSPPQKKLPQISFSLLSLKTSLLLTSLSTPSSLPSHSAQHSPLPTSPTSYHRCKTRAVRILNSEICAACSACFCAARSNLGWSSIRAAELCTSGIGRSFRDVSLEAVSGKAEA